MENGVGGYVRSVAVGAATVTLINDGEGTGPRVWDLRRVMEVPEAEWRPRHGPLFESDVTMHFNSAHIAADGASILVDAGLIEYSPGSIWWPPRIARTPGIVAGLATIGVRPEEITHLVITHAHDDHFAGATERRGDGYEPRFPRARCYAGRADWVQNPALREPDSIESRTLGVLQARGQLELVEGDLDLTPSVRIVAAPGETPGHVAVRVGSNGQTLYCLGDLYHHPVEVEQPSWVPHDRDLAAKMASRAALTEAALAENALLIVAHIPGLGRLRRTPTGVTWVPAP